MTFFSPNSKPWLNYTRKEEEMTKNKAGSIRENGTGKQNLEFSFLYKVVHFTGFLNLRASEILSRVIICCSRLSCAL